MHVVDIQVVLLIVATGPHLYRNIGTIFVKICVEVHVRECTVNKYICAYCDKYICSKNCHNMYIKHVERHTIVSIVLLHEVNVESRQI